MSKIAYHFTGDKLRDGRPVPPIGEWLEHDGPMVICESGLHASEDAFDALSYAPGHMLHLVECEDIGEEHGDKFVCRRRKIIKSINAESLLREFARKQALSVVHLWDAPAVVVEYLETGDDGLRSDARAAAQAAAWAAWAAAQAAARAAWAAAQAAARAAWDAAWAAAGAARDAAWAAARAAARAAWAAALADVGDDVRKMFKEMVEEAFRGDRNE